MGLPLADLIKYALIAIIALFIVIFIMSGYVKAAPNEALIISGLGKKKKVLVGRAGIKIPFFERKDKVCLELIPIDVKTSSAVPTADFINISVDSAVNVQVGKENDFIEKAAANFLNQKPNYIAQVAREVLEGNMREIVGQMQLKEMVTERQKFAEKVKENAEPDLAAMGLKIISFNVQNFMDNEKVIENLGVDNIVAISKTAAIAKANSEKEVKVAQAKADQESNDARVEADQAIAEKQNKLQIRKAELKATEDTKKAEADAAYEIEKNKQRKLIDVANVEADIARQEKEVELQRQAAAVREEALNAEIRKQADAELYSRTKAAEAEKAEKQNRAEAEKFAKQQEAEARKAAADALKYEKEQEAAGIAAVGKAEAEAIQAKGQAEAEAMDKKAEAYAKYNGAAVMQMVIEQLPEMARAISEPIKAIDKVTVIDSGNGTGGVGQFGGYTPAILKGVIESVKETTGFDLTEVMRANTYDAKVNKNISYQGDPAVQVGNVDIPPTAPLDEKAVLNEDIEE